MVDPPKVDSNPLHISWCDSTWVPHLNASNVINYFSERSNPFYSRDCNNEFIKMQQNARIDALTQMQGIEYMLLHAQDPILYIVRKQQRFSPTHTVPQASYQIIAGQVFQTPDLGSVINSRVGSALININSAFSEMSSFSQYHPSKGYSWHFQNKAQTGNSSNDQAQKEQKEKKTSVKEEAATIFQRQRVESIITDLVSKFPYKPPPPIGDGNQSSSDPATALGNAANVQIQGGVPVSSSTINPPTTTSASTAGLTSNSPLNIKNEDIKQEDSTNVKMEVKQEIKTEVKSEPMQQLSYQQQRSNSKPPEKRQRLN